MGTLWLKERIRVMEMKMEEQRPEDGTGDPITLRELQELKPVKLLFWNISE